MIIADTSAWITLLKDPGPPVGREMSSLTDVGHIDLIGPVLTELLQDARSERDLEFLSFNLAGLQFLDTDQQVWNLAGRINFRLRREDREMSFTDLMIAAASIRHQIPLFTTDSGFLRIPELDLYEPGV